MNRYGERVFQTMVATIVTPSPQYPVTPDGRYFVVRGRLWRTSDPSLPPEEKARLVSDLMAARRDVGAGLRSEDDATVAEARRRVDVAKRALGERGPPWWDDGAPDLNRRHVRNTLYADWFAALGECLLSSD
jgi:hypothetical protein